MQNSAVPRKADMRSKEVNPDQAKNKAQDGSKKVKEEVCTFDGVDECEQ